VLYRERTAPEIIANVLQTMQAIDAVCVDGDGLKWFNRLYFHFTQAVESRVNAGGFADPTWLSRIRGPSREFSPICPFAQRLSAHSWYRLFTPRFQILQLNLDRPSPFHRPASSCGKSVIGFPMSNFAKRLPWRYAKNGHPFWICIFTILAAQI
jgi:hypothetical protein